MSKSTAYMVTYCLLPSMLIISLVLRSNLFIQEYYTNLFLYSLIGSILVFSSGLIILKKKQVQVSKFSIIIICITLLWGIYVYINENYLTTVSGKLKPDFLIGSIAIYAGLTFYVNTLMHLKIFILLFFSILAAYESLFCIVQFVVSLKSIDSTSFITGSWGNPNISAMYLAIVLPSIILKIVNSQKIEKKLYILLLVLCATSLILLKCRTAIFGAGISAILVLEWRFRILKSFLIQAGWRKITVVFATGILALGTFGYFLYESKKASADGRLLIWNLSLSMMSNKPLIGLGYGSFEKAYNIVQAQYFKNHLDNEKEIINASHTSMAYNEFIEHIIEGGIIGGLFFSVFLIFLIYTPVHYLWRDYITDNKKNVPREQANEMFLVASSALGLFCLFIMSFVNFTITAVPIMCIFIFYSAFISSSQVLGGRINTLSKTYKYILSSFLFLLGLFTFYRTTLSVQDQLKINKAIKLAQTQRYSESQQLLNSIKIENGAPENYHQIYGNLLYEMNNKSAALATYQAATTYYSSPELYQQIGNCLLAQKDYEGAIDNYETARLIQPNRFTPLYLQMRLYVELRDKEKVKALATRIVEMEEKVPSEKVSLYKQNAAAILKRLIKSK